MKNRQICMKTMSAVYNTSFCKKQIQYQEAEMEDKKLTIEETENVSGGF